VEPRCSTHGETSRGRDGSSAGEKDNEDRNRGM